MTTARTPPRPAARSGWAETKAGVLLIFAMLVAPPLAAEGSGTEQAREDRAGVEEAGAAETNAVDSSDVRARDAASRAPAQESVVCTWEDEPGDRLLLLTFPGTDIVFATHHGYERDAPPTARVNVRLVASETGARMQVEADHGGVRVRGDAALSRRAVLQLDGRARMAGPFLALLRGADLWPRAGAEGGVRVAVDAEGMTDVALEESEQVVVECGELAVRSLAREDVSGPPAQWSEEARRILRPGDAASAQRPQRALPEEGTELRERPGDGARRQTGYTHMPEQVWLLEEQEGWGRVAWSAGGGAAWTGWVSLDDLQEVDLYGRGTGVGRMGETPPQRTVVCEEAQPLTARVGERAEVVGEIAAGVPIPVLQERPENLLVAFTEQRLWVVHGGEFTVPGEARMCADVEPGERETEE